MRITSGSNKALKREVTLRAGDDRRYKFIFTVNSHPSLYGSPFDVVDNQNSAL